MKRAAWVILSLSLGTSAAWTGRARAFDAWPGSSCFFTGASGGNQSIVPFATSVTNNSSNTVNVTCPLTKDAGHNTLLQWSVWVDGTAAWSRTSCNIYWSDSQGTTVQSYPAAHVGLISLVGNRKEILNDGTSQSFNGLGGPAVMICNMPPHSTIYSYIMTEE